MRYFRWLLLSILLCINASAKDRLGATIIKSDTDTDMCRWNVRWKQHKLGKVQNFPLTRDKGIRFGLDGDFLCTASPVAKLNQVKASAPTLSVDLNCKYPETERGVATGLAALEEVGTVDEAVLFLLDPVGEIAHSIFITVSCSN